MNRTFICFASVLALAVPVLAQEPQAKPFTFTVGPDGPSSPIWRHGIDIGSLNVIDGPGGKDRHPSGKFTFVEEDKDGTSPKFEITDGQGVRWKVKLGEEAKSETAASRLLWAIGYFTDEDYYLPEMRVENLPKLSRGSEFVSAGVVRGARLERNVVGQKKTDTWSWSKNPLLGTKELDGLRVMMALINNWDLKESNNAVYELPGQEARFAISDLGATFGQTGNTLQRSKNNLEDYRGTQFIEEAKSEKVDFFLHSRPFLPTAINIPYYLTRTNMQGIVKDIPREHAKWVGQLLGQLSAEQLRDCFRAAGYSPVEVEGFATVVQGRIAELNKL